MTFEQFHWRITSLLQSKPRDVTAELSNYAVAYWDGHRIVYALLHEDASGTMGQEFDPADYLWEDLEPDFAAWCSQPRYSTRPGQIESAGIDRVRRPRLSYRSG